MTIIYYLLKMVMFILYYLYSNTSDILAMNVVLCHYEPYIARLSMRTSIDEYGNPHTSVDEDMRSRLEAKLIEQVLNFKVA